MRIIKTENPKTVRDINSKAILVTDNSAREEYRRRVQEKQMIQSQINTLKDNVDQLKTDLSKEISDLKDIILSAISQKGNI